MSITDIHKRMMYERACMAACCMVCMVAVHSGKLVTFCRNPLSELVGTAVKILIL